MTVTFYNDNYKITDLSLTYVEASQYGNRYSMMCWILGEATGSFRKVIATTEFLTISEVPKRG